MEFDCVIFATVFRDYVYTVDCIFSEKSKLTLTENESVAVCHYFKLTTDKKEDFDRAVNVKVNCLASVLVFVVFNGYSVACSGATVGFNRKFIHSNTSLKSKFCDNGE